MVAHKPYNVNRFYQENLPARRNAFRNMSVGAGVPDAAPRYYYHPTTDTKADDTKGSPKTFDAGVGIYAVTAVLSVTGMAWTAKKRED